MSAEIAKAPETKPARQTNTVEDAIARNAEAIEAALDGAMSTEKFARVCATVFRQGGDKMAKANWGTFVLAMLEAAQLELTPGGVLGECYIIPRNNWRAGRMEANFQLGYRGAMKLARRGGAVKDIQAEVVREKDEFEITLGTTRGIHHVPYFGDEDPGKIIGAYATAVLADGSTVFRAITKKEIDKSKSASGDPRDPNKISDAWRDHEPAMARKTAIHRLVKYLPIPDLKAKEAIIRDEYRDAGVERMDMSPHPHELRKRIEMSDPDHAQRKEYEDLTGKVWTKANKFFAMAGINRDRQTQEGRAMQDRLVMWMAGSNEDWPEQDDRDGRIYFLRLAMAKLQRWLETDEEDQRSMCEEFADDIARLRERDAERRAEEQFEQDQAASETFGEDDVNF